MPKKDTLKQAKRDKAEGKSPSTQAGEFVREEMRKFKEGKGAESEEQAVAIGLSQARRAGVDLPPPKKQSAEVKKRAQRDQEYGDKHGEL